MKTPTSNQFTIAAEWLEHSCKGEDSADCQLVSLWLKEQGNGQAMIETAMQSHNSLKTRALAIMAESNWREHFKAIRLIREEKKCGLAEAKFHLDTWIAESKA